MLDGYVFALNPLISVLQGGLLSIAWLIHVWPGKRDLMQYLYHLLPAMMALLLDVRFMELRYTEHYNKSLFRYF
jgi:hypothetical protein